MNLTTVDDPTQRKFLPSFLRGVAEENKLITSPNFVVTQALVALLADKGARLRPGPDKADVDKRGLYPQRLLYLVKLWDQMGEKHMFATCHIVFFGSIHPLFWKKKNP